MSIMVLRYRANSVTAIPVRMPLEPGAILVLGADAEATIDDLAALIDVWRENPWCAVALLAPEALRRAVLLPLLPAGIRVEAIGEPGDVAALIRGAVGAAVPSDCDCHTYLANRLGASTAQLVAQAVDPDIAGTGARRALNRQRLPPPGYWQTVLGMVRCFATAMAESYTEAAAADSIGLSVKTLSRRCGGLFGRQWRPLLHLAVWEATLEVALRHRGLVTASTLGVRRPH